MEQLKRYIDIDYSKYETDNPKEAYYGLPSDVIFCTNCVISNQRPNSCEEFKNKNSSKETIRIEGGGVRCM